MLDGDKEMDMSVITDKRVFGIKRKNSSGIAAAGQVCANDIILWVIFLLPLNIILHGAGQCFVAIGLFAGNVIGWIFLSKRMNSYADISPKKIHNAPELFAARYDSWLLKDVVSLVWIVTLGAILVSVLKVIVSVAAYFMKVSEDACLALIVTFLVLATIFIDNRLMGIIKTVVLIMVIAACIFLIGCIFHVMSAHELLDNYRRARLSAGTSVYLNILYYDGSYVSAANVVSMTGVGLGCIAMPLMYKGVLTIKNVKELDAGRIWAVIFEGFTIISSCTLDLLVVPVLYPDRVSYATNSFQVYSMLIKRLLGESTGAYVVRSVILMVFILAVVVMLESFMRNICEHIRGLIPPSKARAFVKLSIDVGVVVLAGVLIYMCGKYADYDKEYMIATGWGLCAAALAGPLIFTLMYKYSTKLSMYAGIVSGIAVFLIWQFTPYVRGTLPVQWLGENGDVAGFIVSCVACFAVSLFTKRNDKAELEVFDSMVRDQA